MMVDSTLCEQIILDDAQLLASTLFSFHSFTLFFGVLFGFLLGKFLGERNYFRLQPETINGLHVKSVIEDFIND